MLVNTTYGRVKYSDPDNLYIGEKEEFEAFLGESLVHLTEQLMNGCMHIIKE